MAYGFSVHFVIMGSGRTGATLAKNIEARGHTVAIIDNDAHSFRRLPKDFSGQKVTGEGYDRDTQIQAGIEDAYAFAAVTREDNANVIAARVAREIFQVKKVVARITEPRRAQLFERLGIPTVSMVDRTTQSLMGRLMPLSPEVLFTEETGKLVLCKALLSPDWVGLSVGEIQEKLGIRGAYVTRFSTVSLVNADTVMQENDELCFFTTEENRASAASQLARKIKED